MCAYYTRGDLTNLKLNFIGWGASSTGFMLPCAPLRSHFSRSFASDNCIESKINFVTIKYTVSLMF